MAQLKQGTTIGGRDVMGEIDGHTSSINNIQNTISAHTTDFLPHHDGLNVYVDQSSLDSNGIYTVVNYKRQDGTLYMKSTLSGGTSPNYTTDTWKFYDETGTTVIATKTWTFTYDTDGKIISKEVG